MTFFETGEWPRWRAESRAALREDLRGAVRRYAEGPAQAELLLAGLSVFEARAARSRPIAIAHQLPALVRSAVLGADPLGDPALGWLPWARVTALLEIGIDLHDHLADGEVAGELAQVPPAALVLAATASVACLAHRAIAELPPGSGALHGELARGLLRAAAGQQADFGARTPDDATRALSKTAERYALYARVAAHGALAELALAEEERARQLDAWGAFGRALGAARQLASDLTDLLGEHSRDLASGVNTFPIAWGLAELERRGRGAAAREDLRAARGGDSGAHARVRQALAEVGAFARTAFEVELHCERATRALAQASARGPAVAALEALVDASAIGRETSDAVPSAEAHGGAARAAP